MSTFCRYMYSTMSVKCTINYCTRRVEQQKLIRMTMRNRGPKIRSLSPHLYLASNLPEEPPHDHFGRHERTRSAPRRTPRPAASSFGAISRIHYVCYYGDAIYLEPLIIFNIKWVKNSEGGFRQYKHLSSCVCDSLMSCACQSVSPSPPPVLLLRPLLRSFVLGQ